MVVSPFSEFYADQRSETRDAVSASYANAVARNAPAEVARISASAREGAETQELWWRANALLAAIARAEHASPCDSDMLTFARKEAEALAAMLPGPSACYTTWHPIDTYWDDYLYRGLDHTIGTMAKSSSEWIESRNGSRWDGMGEREEHERESAKEAAESAGAAPPPAPTESSGTQSEASKRASQSTALQSDHTLHEALSNELLRMASVLKHNSIAFADALERDRVLVEQAGERLGQNLDLLTRTRGQLGIFSKKARNMGWFTLSSIIAVLVSWLVMFVVIRLT